VGLGAPCAGSGEMKLGSRQIQPKRALCEQVFVDIGFIDVRVGEDRCTGDVTEPLFPVVYLSWHPQNHLGVEQWCDAAGDLDKVVDDVGSRQLPNQPG